MDQAGNDTVTGKADDRALAEAFVRLGSEDAFRVLYRRYTPRLYALAWRMLGGNEADVCDAVQETWIRAARALPRFEWRSSLSTWLCGITINCCRDKFRDRERHGTIEPEAVERMDARATGPNEKAFDLDRAIAVLPDGFREVLVLHDVEGYTHEEIAEQLGVAVGTSKSQLSRARQRMRELMSSTEEKRRSSHER